jgi:2-dehydropantoate 2-reductase
MKICVFGAGAIGGNLATRLAASGAEVSVVARGEHLAAIRSDGLTLEMPKETLKAHVAASAEPRDLGRQDLVLVCVKAPALPDVAAGIAPLLKPDTPVMFVMNGIPWWYFYKCGGAFDGRRVEAVDPGGRQWTAIGAERAIGCVVDSACELVAPGVVEHREYNRITIGEPDRSISERVKAIGAVLTAAGFDVPIRDGIRWNVWLKLWGNVCFNPISVLTGADVGRIASEPALRALCRRMMLEAKAVSDALGVRIDENLIDRRLDNAAKVTGHKPSMLQDFERGRSLEIDALVLAVAELGRLTSVPTPTIDLVLGLVQERAEQAGLYRRPSGTAQG